MADVFQYNGIQILTPLIKEINSEAVYEESDRSVVFTKTQIRVSGIINGDTSSSMSGFSSLYTDARQTLLVPQGELLVTFGGQTLFDVTGPDDNYGPKPRRCDITEMVGGRFAIVSLEIEIFVKETCPDTTSNIISHTYTAHHEIDSAYMTTRTIAGNIRLSASAVSTDPNANPDKLRGLVTPDLPSGFRRERMSFLVTSDGLRLQYEVVDKEVYRVAPLPACEASARYACQMDNFVWFKHFSIELKGTKADSKLDLWSAAFLIASSKIDFGTDIVKNGVIEEELYENTIRFNVVAQSIDLAGINGLFPKNGHLFADIPGGNDARKIGPWGTALIGAAVTALYDPCASGNAGNNPNIKAREIPADGGAGASSQGSQENPGSPLDTLSNSNLSQFQLQNPYILWEQYTAYDQDNGLDVVPSTKAGSAGNYYQWRNPTAIVKVVGQAVRVNAQVDLPPPTIPFGGRMKRKVVTPHAPELMPDKVTYKYSMTWEYHIVVGFGPDGNNENLLTQGQHANDGSVVVDTDQIGYIIPGNASNTFDPNAQKFFPANNSPIDVLPFGSS